MELSEYINQIRKFEKHSHKGQNGKVMVIGGSDLFHAASRWALDVVSAMVDMVFYASVPENNALIAEAKKEFWGGMVIPRGEIESYIQEADVVLIGPGMTRSEGEYEKLQEPIDSLSSEDWNTNTYKITNYLLATYPEKRWVIDAGALQMVEPALLTKNCIVTPHYTELHRLFEHLEQRVDQQHGKHADVVVGNTEYVGGYHQYFDGLTYDGSTPDTEMDEINKEACKNMSAEIQGATLLLKGKHDLVCNAETVEAVHGGNPGMTKGGTGDALSGLIAGLYTMTDDPFAAAVVGSYVNKKAGDDLYTSVGPFFTTTQLVEQIPKTLKEVLGY